MTSPTETDWVIKLSDFFNKKSLFSSDLILSVYPEPLFVALKTAKIENEWASDGPYTIQWKQIQMTGQCLVQRCHCDFFN
jgi:hypothetical protein